MSSSEWLVEVHCGGSWIIMKDRRLDYAFHVHTARCGHAALDSEESYIEYAIKNDENHGKIPQQKETELRQDSKKRMFLTFQREKIAYAVFFLLCFAKHKSALSFSFILNLKI